MKKNRTEVVARFTCLGCRVFWLDELPPLDAKRKQWPKCPSCGKRGAAYLVKPFVEPLTSAVD
jgi:NAD-dependent SIR2 family protein deacetylase